MTPSFRVGLTMKKMGMLTDGCATGMAISKTSSEMSIEEYRQLMSVNGKTLLDELPFSMQWNKTANSPHNPVDGVFYCAKYAGEIFKSQGFGNLIITSSISAHIVNVPIDQPVTHQPRPYTATPH